MPTLSEQDAENIAQSNQNLYRCGMNSPFIPQCRYW